MRVSRVLGAALLVWVLGAPAGLSFGAVAPIGPEFEITPAMPLRAALEVLRRHGLDLVYSDLLVPADAHIRHVPDPAFPASEQATSLLEPFGLRIERADSGLWYVVLLPGAAQLRPDSQVASTPAGSESGGSEEQVVEELTVVASRHRLARELHEPHRLEHQALASIPSIGRDVLRAVSQLPGIASSGVSARNHVRGGNVDEVLYRIGGAPLIEPFHMAEFQAFFSAVNPDLVEIVDVYGSGFPVSMGSRLTGVIDIELKQPERRLQGSVNVNVINAAAYTAGREDRFEWMVSARRSTLDQLIRYLDRDYGEPRFNDELLQVRWDGDRTAVTGGLLASNDELTLMDPGAGEAAGSDFHNAALWMRLEFAPSDRIDLELLSTLTTVENERDGELINPVDALGWLEESREFDVVTVQPSVRVRLTDAVVLQAGLEGQHQSGDFDVEMRTRYGVLGEDLQPDPELVRETTSGRDGNLFSAYVSIQHPVTDRLQLEYGLRHDLQDNDPVHDHQLSPRLQGRYRVSPELDLYLNAGRYAQHQNLYELQLDDGLLELQPPQVAEQFSAGVDWHPDSALAIRVEAYTRDVSDPWRHFENLYNRWVLLPELHADRVALRPDQARAYGAELSFRYGEDAASGWFGSYTVARTEERLAGDWRPRPWDQEQSMRLGINLRPASWQIDLVGTWHSGWPTNARITGGQADPAAFFGDRLPDYFSLDLHVARGFQFAKGRLEVYGDLTNATFHENVGGQKYVEVDGQLTGRDRELLEPIPALGISWTW